MNELNNIFLSQECEGSPRNIKYIRRQRYFMSSVPGRNLSSMFVHNENVDGDYSEVDGFAYLCGEIHYRDIRKRCTQSNCEKKWSASQGDVCSLPKTLCG